MTTLSLDWKQLPGRRCICPSRHQRVLLTHDHLKLKCMVKIWFQTVTWGCRLGFKFQRREQFSLLPLSTQWVSFSFTARLQPFGVPGLCRGLQSDPLPLAGFFLSGTWKKMAPPSKENAKGRDVHLGCCWSQDRHHSRRSKLMQCQTLALNLTVTYGHLQKKEETRSLISLRTPHK